MSLQIDVKDEDRIAAAVIFITAFIGVVVNIFIAIYLPRLPLLRNSFGRLLQLQAIGDAIFSSVWALYFAPVLFFVLNSNWSAQSRETSSTGNCVSFM
ncbi:hypothetical protein Y032_0141g2208 [Ancylostoma ceylanicum]|uniref:7TM GPCR serpentine receptor class x (Srx) domain-containing protein n=1 Tax=Ancylostoma ceylanicum TaxID=53326 RepID=A0A016T3Y0_9BILA|nr:hypothetical protein Y032_0141g2208 [Ancylostoma ceylanicum]